LTLLVNKCGLLIFFIGADYILLGGPYEVESTPPKDEKRKHLDNLIDQLDAS
jgi:hypothetical protein